MSALLAEEPDLTTGTELALVPPAGAAEEARVLTGDDYTRATLWGSFLAAVTGLSAVPFIQPGLFPAFVLLGAGVGFLAYLDHLTQLIRNRHNLLFGSVMLLVLSASQLTYGVQVLVPALIAAAATFVLMLSASLVRPYFGGGDLKFFPTIAGVLAAFSPLAVLMWLTVTLAGHIAVMAVTRIAGRPARSVAAGPYAAVGLVASIIIVGLFNTSIGL